MESEEYNTPELRRMYYGQADHVRQYGRDYGERLAAAGFLVEEIAMDREYTEDEMVKWGLRGNEMIYIGRKKS